MRSPVTFIVLAGCLSIHGLLAQESPRPTFDVASIRQNKGEPGPPLIDGRTFRQNGQATVTNMSLLAMIQVLYLDKPGMRLEGGPDWLGLDRFDIVAKGIPGSDVTVPAGMPLPRMQAMLKMLLEERFALKTHVERRAMQVYALIPAETDGARVKLKPASDVCTPGDDRFEPQSCVGVQFGSTLIRGRMVSMTMLASFLERLPGIGRPVDDDTSITGFFDVDIRTGSDPRATPAEQGAAIITALKDQLGLVLKSKAGSRDVLVIDHAERPAPN